MTADIAAVLIIPAPGDPLGLLAEGSCGARPPVVVQVDVADGWVADPDAPLGYVLTVTGEQRWEEWDGEPWQQLGGPRALVLAWDGEPVPEGLFVLWRALWGVMSKNGQAPPPLTAEPGMHHVLEFGRLADALRCVGTRVLLDSEGREVNRG